VLTPSRRSKELQRDRITVFRYNSASLRVRIIDERFAGLSLDEREDLVWPLLQSLPNRVRDDIKILLLLAPDETTGSLMNLEFEKPSRSRL
jgi:hypothetical protein